MVGSGRISNSSKLSLSANKKRIQSRTAEKKWRHHFSHYDDPRGVANLDPRGMIGRIYVEYHVTLLQTKYTSFRPCGFREEDF